VALAIALHKLKADGKISSPPLKNHVAAVSVGIVKGAPLLDLDYSEDSTADVDLNLAAVDDGRIIEIQGTAEGKSYSKEELSAMTDLALKGVRDLMKVQETVLKEAGVDLSTLIEKREDVH
jgi:ribonuclease PH